MGFVLIFTLFFLGQVSLYQCQQQIQHRRPDCRFLKFSGGAVGRGHLEKKRLQFLVPLNPIPEIQLRYRNAVFHAKVAVNDQAVVPHRKFFMCRLHHMHFFRIDHKHIPRVRPDRLEVGGHQPLAFVEIEQFDIFMPMGVILFSGNHLVIPENKGQFPVVQLVYLVFHRHSLLLNPVCLVRCCKMAELC